MAKEMGLFVFKMGGKISSEKEQMALKQEEEVTWKKKIPQKRKTMAWE